MEQLKVTRLKWCVSNLIYYLFQKIDWIERVNLNKRFYARTNKTKTFVTQIAKHLHRKHVLRKILQCVDNCEKQAPPSFGGETSDISPDHHVPANMGPSVPFEQSDPLPLTPPEVHHHISNTQQFYENIPQWLDLHNGDLALIICLFYHLNITSTDFILRISFQS